MTRFFLSAILVCLMSAPLHAADAIGTVTHANGDATLKRAGADIALATGTAIALNDTINTDKDAHVKIQFDDMSKLTIGANSSVTVDHFVYQPAENIAESALHVGKGFFRFIGGKDAHKRAKITTPLSTIGIRGTDLFGEVKDGGVTLIGLIDCCVDISTEAGTVALEEPGTFSKVTSRDTMPSAPIVCKPAWIEKSAKALGVTFKDLDR